MLPFSSAAITTVDQLPLRRSTFAPHTIVPPSGGTQPLPPNPVPLLPNQAPPELVAESPLDPVGTVAPELCCLPAEDHGMCWCHLK
jgi:hypothetical protein